MGLKEAEEKSKEIDKAVEELLKEMKEGNVILPYSGFAISQLRKEEYRWR